MSQELYILFLAIILVIIVYMSMVTYARLHGRTFHEDLLPSMYHSDFPEDDFDGGILFKEKVRKMEGVIRDENLVIGGLVYNMEEKDVRMLEKRLTYVTRGWKTVKIHVYGMDSGEKYIRYLKDWRERDERVVLLDKMDGVSWKNKNVFVKMSNLRNRVHESLGQYCGDQSTFFLSMDYDLGGPISREGLLHARYLMEDQTIGAVYANGIVSDSFINTIPGLKGWCFPGLGFCYYDDLALQINDTESKEPTEGMVSSWWGGWDESKMYKWFTITRGRGSQHVEVKSAYGGAGLMRIDLANELRYDESNTTCEHHAFNASIRRRGLKVIVDPSFILLAGCQGHHLTRKVE